MKLLIDEMYPAALAQILRDDGHDAVSILEDPETRGLSDDAVYALAVSARRAVVTENAADFLAILRQHVASGKAAASLIVKSNRAFPRHSKAFIGRAGELRSTSDYSSVTSFSTNLIQQFARIVCPGVQAKMHALVPSCRPS